MAAANTTRDSLEQLRQELLKIKAANAALIEQLNKGETTTTKKRTKGGKEPSAKAESGTTRQPPKLRVISYDTRYVKSCELELEDLLDQVRAGSIVGIGYAVITENRSVRAGLAGILASDRLKAAGALFTAAQRVADTVEDE